MEKSNFTVTQEGDAAGKDRLTNSDTATNGIAGATVDTGMIKAGSNAQTVILTVDNGAAFKNGKTISVTVTGIKDGEATMADVTKTAVLSDTAVPTVVKAESKASNQIKVLFSEPVFDGANDNFTNDLKANFKINDGAVGISSVVKDSQDPNAVIITTYADLAAGTEYTVKINSTSLATNIQDYANYKVMTDTVVKFAHTVEAQAPTVTAEARGESTVRLTFSRPVIIPNSSNIEFRYAYNAEGANKVAASALTATAGKVDSVSGSNGTQYDIPLAPMLQGEGTLYINYTNPTDSTKSNVIKDGFGNVISDDTLVTFKVTEDKIAPTATVTYKDATSIDVVFNEKVSGATTTSNYEVKDKDGKPVVVSSISTVDATKNHYRLTVASMAKGGNYTIAINDKIKDVSVNTNKFVPKTFTITAPDTFKPSVSNAGAIGKNTNGDKLYVYYDEEMGASATDLANYRLSDGAAQYSLPAGTTITQIGSTVTISLPKTLTALQTDLSSGAIDKLFIGAVKDKAGNQLGQMKEYGISATATTTFAPVITKGKLLSDTQVSFVVDKQLKSIDATKISVNGTATAGGANKAQTATFVNNADGTATVTATFAANKLSNDSSVTTKPVNIDTNITIAEGALTDLFDLTNDADGSVGTNNNTLVAKANFDDYAAPAIKSITTKDSAVVNGKIDTIEVSFTENLYASSVQESDFTVEGYTITGVKVNNDTVEISVLEKGSPDGEAKPTVTLVGEVEDDISVTVDQPSRNKLTGSVTKATTDGVAPLVVTPAKTQVAANNGTIQIVFSEELNSASKTAVETAIDNGKVKGTLTFSWSGSTLTVTNTHATDATVFAADIKTTGAITDVNGKSSAAEVTVVDLP